MFPNDYAVYLHDTPAQALFDKTERAFSHGCIRLDEPLVFAEWVLKKTADENRTTVETQLISKERETIVLDEDIPVYITYFTAWADPDGTIFFLNDIYDRDDKLSAALEKSKPALSMTAP